MKIDVLVVGAGPVGLTMAAELKRYGLSVRIVEKAARATDKSKALVVWSRTLELMDRMGCTASFLRAGFQAKGANVSSGEKQIAHISLGSVASAYPFALMIPQSETERLLALHLASLGVSAERKVELTSLSQSAEGVQATLRHINGGEEEAIEASWLVGCDGAHSTVRHQLGLEFVGDTLISDWILADIHLAGVPNPEEVSVMWHADGVLVFFPIGGDRYRVIADVGTAVEGPRRPDPTLEEVQGVLDHRGPGGITASQPIWLASFRINERKVTDYRVGRVFLAGDAAHIHSPAGGQGMNTGMQDACNLAWKLALVHRGQCAAAPLLESYSTERSAVGDQVLAGAGRVTTLATMRGGVKQAIRNHIASLVFGFPFVREKLADAITELSIGYPASSLNVSGETVSGGPVAGQRAPIRAGETPVGAGGTPRFVLFAEADDEVTALLARYPELLESEVRCPYEAGGLWLVRPDGYVVVAAKQGDGRRVAEFFGNLGVKS